MKLYEVIDEFDIGKTYFFMSNEKLRAALKTLTGNSGSYHCVPADGPAAVCRIDHQNTIMLTANRTGHCWVEYIETSDYIKRFETYDEAMADFKSQKSDR